MCVCVHCFCVSTYPSFVVSATAAMSCTVLGLWWICICSPKYFWTKSPGVMNLSPSLSTTLAYWGENQKTSTTTALAALTVPKLKACLVSVQNHEFGAWQSTHLLLDHRSAVLQCYYLRSVYYTAYKVHVLFTTLHWFISVLFQVCYECKIIKFNFEISTSQKHQLCNLPFTKLCWWSMLYLNHQAHFIFELTFIHACVSTNGLMFLAWACKKFVLSISAYWQLLAHTQITQWITHLPCKAEQGEG